MKFLLIYTKDEEDTVVRLEAVMQKINIFYEVFLLNSPKDMDINRFASFFDFFGSEDESHDNFIVPTHVLVVSSLDSQWFDFLAGFAFGSRIHLLIYKQEAIAGISKEFAAFFTFLGTEASLQTYLEVESEVYKKQDAARSIIKAQESLLRTGVPITVSSLTQCVKENRITEIALFFAAGFSVNSRNNDGVPMLNVAARHGNRDVICYLLSKGTDVNLRAEDRGSTALIDSVMAQHHDIAEDLINAGTDLDVKDKNGQTALIVAAGAGKEKMVELLLKAGANADIPDSLGVSARKYALLFRNEIILSLFDTYAPA